MHHFHPGRRNALLGLAALAAGAAPARGADYPNRPVRMVAATAAGSTPDIVARLLAQELAREWGQGVVVDNQASAGGTVAMRQLLQAPPDAYTLVLSPSSATSLAPAMFKLPYDLRKDAAGITRLANVPNVLVVNPSVSAQTVQEFIAEVRRQPGRLNFASSGNGTPSHLDGELFKSLTQIDMVHVPYRGSPPALTAVIQNDAQAMFCPIAIALPYIKQGKLRPLGVTTAQRADILPDVPPIGESGVRGYATAQWYALFARAGTPRELIDRITADVVRIMRRPATAAVLDPLGVNIVTSTPAELDDFLRRDIDKWAKVVASTKAKVD